jgi:hypothetical protein
MEKREKNRESNSQLLDLSMIKKKKTYGERRVGDQDPIDAMLLEKGSHSFTAKIIMSGLWSS